MLRGLGQLAYVGDLEALGLHECFGIRSRQNRPKLRSLAFSFPFEGPSMSFDDSKPVDFRFDRKRRQFLRGESQGNALDSARVLHGLERTVQDFRGGASYLSINLCCRNPLAYKIAAQIHFSENSLF